MQKNNINHPLFEKNSLPLDKFILFEQKILALSKVINVALNKFTIDHIAIRVNHCKSAEQWLTLLLKCGRIISDNIINGRVIYLVQLQQPLYFANQFIDVIELPFPKNKHYPVEDWEHIEVVVPFLANESVSDWVLRMEKQFLWGELKEVHIKVDEPKAEGEIYPNPSIALSFMDKLHNHTCIKVHPYHIKKIIEVFK
ncbi:metalloprotein [Bisgaardia hudsonensis]|nr:VOC family protein [Bisgaardia hudsonensis]QLB13250.1 metalloprotein [Bisgaardia hudsonensis]